MRINNLQDTHNAANLANQISKPGGPTGQIGGVGLDSAIIEGLFNSLSDHREYQHLFFLDGKELPFSSEELNQILHELARGVFATGSIPYFSLHFNPNHNLYPVIHPVYQNTLVGEVFAMLDYLMKGYLNGGFIDKEGVAQWNRSDRRTAPQFHSYSNYLFEASGDSSGETEYLSLTSMITLMRDQLSAEEHESLKAEDPILMDCDNFTSAFRIIASQKNISKSKNLFLIDGGFEVFYDLNIDPVYQEHLKRHRLHRGGDPLSFKILNKAYRQMSRSIEQNMPRLPICEKYFKMLRVIHLLAYYFKTLQSHQKIPVLKPPRSNCERRAPVLFPSLPISAKSSLDVNVMTTDILKHLNNREKRDFLRFLNDQPDDATLSDDMMHSIIRASKIHFHHSRTPNSPSESPDSYSINSEYGESNYRDKLESRFVKSQNVEFYPFAIGFIALLKSYASAARKSKSSIEHLNREVQRYTRLLKELNSLNKLNSFDSFQDPWNSHSISTTIDTISSIDFQVGSLLEPHASSGAIPDLEELIESVRNQLKKFKNDLRRLRIDTECTLDPVRFSWSLTVPFYTVRNNTDEHVNQERVNRNIVGGCGLDLSAKYLIEEPLCADLVKQNLQLISQAPSTTWFAISAAGTEGFAFKLDIRDFYSVNSGDYHWLLSQGALPAEVEADKAVLESFLASREGAYTQIQAQSVLARNPDLARAELMRAAVAEDPIHLKKLIRLEIDLKLTDADGFSALHYALNAKRMVCAAILMSRAPDLLGEIAGDGSSPIAIAASSKNAQIARLVLHGATREWREHQVKSGTPLAVFEVAEPGDERQAEPPLNTSGCSQLFPETLWQTSLEGMTPLFRAVESGDEAVTRELLQVSSVPKFVDTAIEDGTTPLILASERGYLTIVKALIEKKADLNLPKKNGYRALHAAAAAGDPDVLRALIDAPGLNINARLKTEKSALHVAAQFDHWPCAHLLLSRGIDTTLRGWDEETFFLTAIAHDSIKTASGYLRNDRWHTYISHKHRSYKVIDWPNRWNQTAIDIAQHHGSTNILRVMDEFLNRPSEISLRSTSKWLQRNLLYGRQVYPENVYLTLEKRLWQMCHSEWDHERFVKFVSSHTFTKGQLSRGLQLAARGNRKSFVRYLLNLGPDRVEDLPDIDGRTTLHYAAQFDWQAVTRIDLHRRPEEAAKADGKGWTPLMIAAASNSFNALKILLTVSEQVQSLFQPGSPALPHPLQLALEAGQTQSVDVLLDAMDDANLPLSEAGLRGCHVAAKIGDCALLRALRAKGANLNLVDQEGRTALHIAIEAGRGEALSFLLELTWPESVLKRLVHWTVDHNQVRALALLRDRKFSLETPHPDTQTPPLFQAVQGDHLEVLLYLLKSGVNVNVTCQNQTALHLAAKLKFARALDLMIQAGARLNAVDALGKTPLQLAIESASPLAVQRLIASGAKSSLDQHQLEACHTAAQKSGRIDLLYLVQGKMSEYESLINHLVLAAQGGDLPAFKRHLQGLHINALVLAGDLSTTLEQPLLHLVYCKTKKSECKIVFNWLMQQPQIEVNAPNSVGFTLAHLMALAGDVHSHTALLLTKGDLQGDTPLHLYARGTNCSALKEALGRVKVDAVRNNRGETPLFAAIGERLDENVDLLLRSKADPNALDCEGWRPLHRALRNRASDFIVRRLLEAGADSNCLTQDAERLTPLYLAAENGNFEQILQLFSSRANPKGLTGSTRLPIHAAASSGSWQSARLLKQRSASVLLDNKNQTPIDIAAAKGHLKIIQLLEESGFAEAARTLEECRNRKAGKSLYRPYITAARHGQKEAFMHLWPNAANLDRLQTEESQKALASAAGQNPPLIETILGPASDWPHPNLTEAVIGAIAADRPEGLVQLAARGYMMGIPVDEQETTPLHLAAAYDARHCCEWLIRRGVETQALDARQRIPAVLAAQNGNAAIARRLIALETDFSRHIFAHSLLHDAAKRRDLVMADILLEHSIDLTALDENGRSALHWALLSSDLSMARLLLLAGADIEQKDLKERSCRSLLIDKGRFADQVLSCAGICSTSDCRKESPLHSAVRMRDPALLQVALYRLHPDLQNSQGQTPLHLAAQLGKEDAVISLIQQGADLNARDIHGRTPLCLALLEAKGAASAQLLIKSGAQIDSVDGEQKSALQVLESRRDRLTPHLYSQLMSCFVGAETPSDADSQVQELDENGSFPGGQPPDEGDQGGPSEPIDVDVERNGKTPHDVRIALLDDDEELREFRFEMFSTQDLHGFLNFARSEVEPPRASRLAAEIIGVLKSRCDLKNLPPRQNEQFLAAETALREGDRKFAFVSLNQLSKDLLMVLMAQALKELKLPSAHHLSEYIRKKRT